MLPSFLSCFAVAYIIWGKVLTSYLKLYSLHSLMYMLGAVVSAVLSPKSTCAQSITCCANCTYSLPFPDIVTWTSISLQTTYTDQVIIIIDDENNSTRTITSHAAIPSSELDGLVRITNTNSDGYKTVTVRVPSGSFIL